MNLMEASWSSFLREEQAAASIVLSVPAAQTGEKENYMKVPKEFPFEKARRISAEEVAACSQGDRKGNRLAAAGARQARQATG